MKCCMLDVCVNIGQFSDSDPFQGCYRSFQALIFGSLLRILLGVAISILVFEV